MKFETLCLHAGHTVDETTLSRGVPVYRTASYLFRNVEHASNLFSLKELGNIYTRLMNPTQDVLESRIASLENGAASLALSSGTSAIFYSIINLAQAGDEIISSSALYGGTFTQFSSILPRFGITVKFVDPQDPENFAKAISSKTKALYTETIGNPGLIVSDIPKIADIAHAHKLPLIVDSTFTTPYLQKPIELGADIVLHSLTKWLGGHGIGIGGCVIDSAKFNWAQSHFPIYNEPDLGYHGLRFAHDLGELSPLAYILRMRLVPLRNIGACITPDNAWMFLQGIETLPLRMQKHCSNAMQVAQYLKEHKKVEWVNYPGLITDSQHAVASRVLQNGFGGVVVFGIKGRSDTDKRTAGGRFIDSLKLVSHLANVGDAKTLALHPASTSHSQLSDGDQEKAGVRPELVRLSVGIENIDDILADIDQALSV